MTTRSITISVLALGILLLALAGLGLGLAAADEPIITIDADYAAAFEPRTSPVEFYYNPSGEPIENAGATVVGGTLAWNEVTPNFQFIYGGLTSVTQTQCNGAPNGRNEIIWNGLAPGVGGLACYTSGNGGECDIELSPLIPAYALRAIALHEAGHCAGLAHSNDATAVMYAGYSGATNLTADDRAGIIALYGAGEPVPVDATLYPGWNLVGATRTERPEDYVARNACVTAIYYWDAPRQDWHGWFANVPQYAIDLHELVQGRGYWIFCQ